MMLRSSSKKALKMSRKRKHRQSKPFISARKSNGRLFRVFLQAYHFWSNSVVMRIVWNIRGKYQHSAEIFGRTEAVASSRNNWNTTRFKDTAQYCLRLCVVWFQCTTTRQISDSARINRRTEILEHPPFTHC